MLSKSKSTNSFLSSKGTLPTLRKSTSEKNVSLINDKINKFKSEKVPKKKKVHIFEPCFPLSYRVLFPLSYRVLFPLSYLGAERVTRVGRMSRFEAL